VVEREALKCVLQEPGVVAEWYAAVEPTAYSHPAYVAVHQAIAAAGGASETTSGLEWMDLVLAQCPDDGVRSLVRALAVEPVPTRESADEKYATSVVARLLENDAARRVADLKGRLQRTDPAERPVDHERLFNDLLALETYRRRLREHVHGET
jgi:DNA primase